MRTFTSLITEALSDDFAPSKYQAQVGLWINDCLRLMARNAHIPLSDDTSSPSVVAGTASYSLPTDLVRVVEVWNTSTHEPLEEVDQTWIDDQPATSGTPQAYALYQGNLVLWPTPSAVTPIQLRYISTSADLAGSDPLAGVIPDEHAETVVTYCRWHLFRMEDDVEMATYWQAQHEAAFIKLKADLQHRGRRVRQVPGMWRTTRAPRFVRP